MNATEQLEVILDSYSKKITDEEYQELVGVYRSLYRKEYNAPVSGLTTLWDWDRANKTLHDNREVTLKKILKQKGIKVLSA